MLLLLLMSCGQRKQIEITDLVHYDTNATPEIIDELGCINYDSVSFSDGSYAVSQLKFSPQNWLIRYVDTNKRVIATISAASETGAQCLIYGYDENGRLKYLLGYDDMLEWKSFNVSSDSAYLHFRLASDSIDFQHPDLT